MKMSNKRFFYVDIVINLKKMQPQLVNLKGHANPDQIFGTIGQIGGIIGQVAQTGQGIDHLFHPNGDPKADQAFGTMSQASGMIQQGA